MRPRHTEDDRAALAGWLRAHPDASTRDVRRVAGLTQRQALRDLQAIGAERRWDEAGQCSRWTIR